jgi:threonine/homoserine/homoserine lactone efflux protein
MNEYIFLLPISFFLLLGVMSPGPSFILVAHTAMEESRAEAIAVSIGLGIGSVIFAIIAAVGLFIILDTIPLLYFALKVLGGSYLCFLAYKMWASSKEPMVGHSTGNKVKNGITKMFFTGLITQLGNPKTAIVFASAFATFMPAEAPEYSYYLIALSVFFIDSGWYVLLATLLSTSKAQRIYGKFKKHVCRIAAGFMGLMGIKLLTSQQLP